MRKSDELFLVGKITNYPAFEFQGVFDSEELAIRACKTEDYFYAPVILNQEIPEETMEWENTVYPMTIINGEKLK